MKRMILSNRRLIAEVLHGSLAAFALFVSFLVRFDFTLDPAYVRMLFEALPLILAAKLSTFRLFELQHLGWRYLGFTDLLKLGSANAAASLIAGVIVRLVLGPAFPRSVYIIDLVMCV